MARVAIIGAGTMGLATAFFAQRAGHDVVVFESDRTPGGMAAHFDFDGLSIERFYHFVCKADTALFDLLEETGLGDAMRWRTTSMGLYHAGVLHNWGDPLALLRFPGLGLTAKLRYGLHAFLAVRRRDWARLDRISAERWLKRWLGEEAYRVCWERLFALKFFEFQDDISAAWIWSRMRRIGTSRRNLMQEELGYIEGGSETLVKRLVEALEQGGAAIRLGERVRRITIREGVATGVMTAEGHEPFDAVISTVAIPYAVEMLSDLPTAMLERYRALPNIAVVCVVHKLRRAVSEHFWVNINDPGLEIPGVVEFSNLRRLGSDHIVYIPYYMPQTHPRFHWSDDAFLAETRRCLKHLNPDLREHEFVAARIGRLRYAQPICSVRFRDRLPPINPNVRGLQVADTSYYYPEDRGLSEGIRLARLLARQIDVELVDER